VGELIVRAGHVEQAVAFAGRYASMMTACETSESSETEARGDLQQGRAEPLRKLMNSVSRWVRAFIGARK
jgi:hypothetical protein